MGCVASALPRRSRWDRDRMAGIALAATTSASVLTVLLILAFVIGSGSDALRDVGLGRFLLGTDWDADAGTFGAGPMILGTFLVTAGAMAISMPLGLSAAVYISEIASPRMRRVLKPLCEVLAGIPSVVYGFFGLLTVLPALRALFPEHLLFGNSWLAGSLLLGIMTLPTVISVSEDALHSVPDSYREASLAMGATRWETTVRAVIPAAMSGIAAAAILGIGRAVGETMAVMMVTGNTAIVPDPIYDVFSLISTITGVLALQIPEAASGGELYSALFLLASVLLAMTLAVNATSRLVVRRSEVRTGAREPRRSRTAPDRIMDGRGRERILNISAYACLGLSVWMLSDLLVGRAAGMAVAASACIAMSLVERTYRAQSPATRQRICHGAMAAAMAAVLAVLAVIVADVLSKGLPAIGWGFLTGGIEDEGRGGGILPAIVGTLELMAGTAALALPAGMLTGVYLSEYAGDTRLTAAIREAIDLLNGTPSIVFGLFGMAFVVKALGIGVSLLAGWIVLSVMVVPVVIKTTEEALKAVPVELREASLALGAGKWRTTAKVAIPAAMGGITTGAVLAMGRAAGETAPIMFTAAVTGSTAAFAGSVLDPVMALPYHLYYLSSQVTGSADMQYATATVLLLIVLSMFALASVLRTHYSRRTGGD